MVNLIIDTETIVCTGCKIEHPATEEYFYKRKYMNNGELFHKLTQPCKECRKAKGKEYYSDPTHKFEQKIRHARWSKKNRDLISENNRKLFAEREDFYKDYQNNYRKNNMKQLYSYALDRKEKGIVFKLTKKEWDSCKTYFDYCCAYCGMTEKEHKQKHNQQLHKEHVIKDGKNNLRNCVPSCKECNSQKSQYPLNKWYNLHNNNYTRERYLKIYQWIRYDSRKYMVKKKKK